MLALVPKLMLGDVFFGGSPSLATGMSLSGVPGFIAAVLRGQVGSQGELGNQGKGRLMGENRGGPWGVRWVSYGNNDAFGRIILN